MFSAAARVLWSLCDVVPPQQAGSGSSDTVQSHRRRRTRLVLVPPRRVGCPLHVSSIIIYLIVLIRSVNNDVGKLGDTHNTWYLSKCVYPYDSVLLLAVHVRFVTYTYDTYVVSSVRVCTMYEYSQSRSQDIWI